MLVVSCRFKLLGDAALGGGNKGYAHLSSSVIQSLGLLKSLRKELQTANKVMVDQAQEISELKSRGAKFEYQIKHLKRSLIAEEE